MRDLIVAGGGPVGLATAMYAVRAGLDVALHEPRPGVIDKACGEGLMPGAVAALSDLGIPLDGRPITGIRYVDRARAAEARFHHGNGMGVRRTTLHAAMLQAASDLGITPVPARVNEIVDRGDHLLVDGLATRYLVAADGLHSPVRRMLGLGGRTARRRRYGLRCHVEIEPWTGFVEVHWAATGEAYVTPVDDGQVGVAVLSADRRPWPDLLHDFTALSDRLSGAACSRVRGAGPLRQRSRRAVAGRVLLVGDAAGYVDALTGEGIALGLAQAGAAVSAVAADDPRRYASEHRRLGWRHDLLTTGLLTATQVPLVRKHIVSVATRTPRVFTAAVNQLARPA